MKKYLPWLVVAVALLVGYYFYATPEANVVNVTLAELNDSKIYGSATLKEENGNTVVTLALTGESADVAMPAHIHEGQCPGVGAVKCPLEAVVNGASTTTLTGVTLASLKGMIPLAINVHKSADEISNYVSCGSLSL